MTIILVLGFSFMLAAPLLRRYKRASHALGADAPVIVGLAIFGLAQRDPSMGSQPSNRIAAFTFFSWLVNFRCSFSR